MLQLPGRRSLSYSSIMTLGPWSDRLGNFFNAHDRISTGTLPMAGDHLLWHWTRSISTVKASWSLIGSNVISITRLDPGTLASDCCNRAAHCEWNHQAQMYNVREFNSADLLNLSNVLGQTRLIRGRVTTSLRDDRECAIPQRWSLQASVVGRKVCVMR